MMTYGEDVKALKAEQYSNRPFKIPDTIVEESDVQENVWIVSEPFRCVHYLNNARFLPEDKTTDIVKNL